jgi:hypothetical protein
MTEHEQRGEMPVQVRKFAPKRKIQGNANPTDDAGNALLAMLHEAAKLSHENRDGILALAHRFSVELRAAEDRIKELEADVEHNRDRALRAEKWLERIQTEIEAKLLVPLATIRSEQTPLQIR